MARKIWGRHTTVMTGTNDGTKQVSKDAWNADMDTTGMLGFTAANKTLLTDALTPVDTVNIIAGEGGLADNFSYITYGATPEVANKDILILFSDVQTITVKHNTATPPANSGNIQLLGGADITLDANVPLVLQRVGNTFYEIAANKNITNVMISASAAIAYSKLASLTSGNILVGSAGNVCTAVAMSGDATIIASGAITLATAVRVIGLQDMWIPAAAFWKNTTNPATGLTQTETTTNKLNHQSYSFGDNATSDKIECSVVMPRNYNNGTIKGTFYWTVASGTGTIIWQLAAVALGDNVALDTAQGTLQAVTDTILTANNLHISPQTPAITVGSTPASTKLIQLRITRDNTDTATVAALFLGLELEYTISQATAA